MREHPTTAATVRAGEALRSPGEPGVVASVCRRDGRVVLVVDRPRQAPAELELDPGQEVVVRA